MAMRRVVVVAMPCTEVVDVAGLLDIFYAVNERTDRAGASDGGYAVEVVSPVETVCALRLRRELRPARGHQGAVRSGQLLAGEPERCGDGC